jgi:hypothetical protein
MTQQLNDFHNNHLSSRQNLTPDGTRSANLPNDLAQFGSNL